MTRVAILVLVAGCSFAFVNGPPPSHRQLPAFDCSTSHVAPVLDTLFTALEIANLTLAASQSDQQWANDFPNHHPPFDRTTAIPVYVALVALGGAGMYYGYSRVGECRHAKDELDARTQPTGVPPGVWTSPAEKQTLVEDGKAAAARDDCPTAIAIGQQLAVSDAAAYELYAHDGGVAACLAHR